MARILIVDDESNIRLMISLALTHVEHHVGTAPDGEEGLRIFGDGGDWDLVLLDLRMAGMDGMQVLRAMRERQPDARVVLITAFGTIDLAYQATREGAIDFLRKPFTAEVLRGAVTQALVAAPPPPAPKEGFAHVTINGFRLEPASDRATLETGERGQSFQVRGPLGDVRPCRVVLPAEVVSLVRQQTRLRDDDAAKWSLLCEEILANYVWQHSDVPCDGVVRVDDLTGGLRRFIDTVMAEDRG